MIGLTLKHLRYLDALARHRHFGRAAETCGISQPALSMQIKELESMFGAPLVERGARSVRLTPTGEELLRRGREILLAVDEIDDLVRASQGAAGGRMRLGVIPTVAPYLLPQVVTTLAQRYPTLEVQPREAVTATLIAGLQEGRLDAAIVALPISEPSLREFALFREEFVLVRQAADAGQPVPSPDKLKEMRLLLLEEGHCFRNQALSFCAIDALGPRDLMEGSSLTTLVQMVGAGIGVTLIPEMAVPFETRAARVSVARFPPPGPSRTVGMVWRKTNPLSNEFMQIGAIVRGIGQTVRGPRTSPMRVEVID